MFDPEIPTVRENCGSCVVWCFSEERCSVQHIVVKLMAEAEKRRIRAEKRRRKREESGYTCPPKKQRKKFS